MCGERFSEEQCCKLCGLRVDNMLHRFASCPAKGAIPDEDGHIDRAEWVRKALLKDDPGAECTITRAIVPHDRWDLAPLERPMDAIHMYCWDSRSSSRVFIGKIPKWQSLTAVAFFFLASMLFLRF